MRRTINVLPLLGVIVGVPVLTQYGTIIILFASSGGGWSGLGILLGAAVLLGAALLVLPLLRVWPIPAVPPSSVACSASRSPP